MKSHKTNIEHAGLMFSPKHIPKSGKVYIYGASDSGGHMFNYVESISRGCVYAFIDGFKIGAFNERPILSPTELLEVFDAENDICLIGPGLFDEKSKILSDLGISNIYNTTLFCLLNNIFLEEASSQSDNLNYYDKVSDLFFYAFYHLPENTYILWSTIFDTPYFHKFNSLDSYKMSDWFRELTYRNISMSRRKIENPYGTEPVVISLAVWGEEYFSMFQRQFLPCMLADGNLPSLNNRKTILDVTLYEDFIQAFLESEIYAEVSNFCEVIVSPLSQKMLNVTQKADRFSGNLKFNLYGSVHNASMLFAFNNKGIVFNLAPDNLHSENELSCSIKYIEEGYQAICFTCVRAYFPALTEEYKKQTGTDLNNSLKIQLTGEEIGWFSSEYFETNMLQFVISDINTRPYPQIASNRETINIFPQNNALEMRTFNTHVLAMHHSFSDKINEVSTITACHYLLNIIKNPQELDRIKIVDDLQDFGMVDIVNSVDMLENLDRGSAQYKIPKLLTVENFIEGCASASPFYRWIFAHNLRLATRGGPAKIWFDDKQKSKSKVIDVPENQNFPSSENWTVQYFAGCMLYDLDNFEETEDPIFDNLNETDLSGIFNTLKDLKSNPSQLSYLKENHSLEKIINALIALSSQDNLNAEIYCNQIVVKSKSWWLETIRALIKSTNLNY